MRRPAFLSAAAAVIAALASSAGCGPQQPAGPYPVEIEGGSRRTAGGDCICYSLFIPKPADGLPGPPWPGVILTHAFARSRANQRNNALYMAQRGIIVLTPDMVSLLPGESAQLRNIANTIDHIAWLAQRSRTEGDPLNGLLDAARIGLAGHSAGGAVSFEAAIDSQSTDAPAAALCLLDAVPWERTIDRAGDLQRLPFSSLRSEPSVCNAQNSILSVLAAMRFPVQDILIIGATHCDPEDPTDALCKLACQGGSAVHQQQYTQLMYLFFRDALAAPSVDPESASYEDTVAQGQADGTLGVQMTGNP